jgi:3-keto-L-gulonate-6-phosphate decarboxylase
MSPIVQISLDLTNIDEALETAAMALRAGVDWLEAGTPLILAEGLHGVRALRKAFPGVPIVADLKTMDGGYLEAEMMAKAGATHVVVMARAHEETVKCVVQVVRAVSIPVQAVGGLSLEQAIACPALGAPLVVLGAPLTIDADQFKTATGDLETSLKLICQAIKKTACA